MRNDNFREGARTGFYKVAGWAALMFVVTVALLYAAFHMVDLTRTKDKDFETILDRTQVVLVCDDGTWIKRDPQTGSVYASKLVGGTMRFSEVYPKMMPGGLGIICSN